jgi:hypothetical protein
MADEQRDRSCPMRSLSPRNCGRHDSHPRGRAGAIAGKHSALVPRKTLEKPVLRQRRARNRLNGQTCSLRCDLLSGAGFAQAISCESTIGKGRLISNGFVGVLRKNLNSRLVASAASGRTSASVIGGFFARQNTLLKCDATIPSGRVRRC